MGTVWSDAQSLVKNHSDVLMAAGEFFASLFSEQEKIKIEEAKTHAIGKGLALPSEDYMRRPIIGLRLELPNHQRLTAKCLHRSKVLASIQVLANLHQQLHSKLG